MPTTAQRQLARDLADAKRLGFSRLTADAQRRILAAALPEQALELLAANPRYAAGDVVGVNSPKFAGVRFRVEKVNPARYNLVPVTGGRGVAAPHDMVCADPAATEPGVPGPPVPEPAYVPPVLMAPGTFVRYAGTQRIAGVTPGSVAVVISDRGGERVTVARPGGGPSAACLRANRVNLRVVDPATVLA